jgi:hypothetical protein
VRAITDLVLALGWRSVDVVTADSSQVYARSLLDEFLASTRPMKDSAGHSLINICSFQE